MRRRPGCEELTLRAVSARADTVSKTAIVPNDHGCPSGYDVLRAVPPFGRQGLSRVLLQWGPVPPRVSRRLRSTSVSPRPSTTAGPAQFVN